MDRKLKLPIGIDNFEKIRKENFYYVDKTKLIEQLLERWGEVNLFTRPRRFGKTLNMSMLECFFSNKYKDRGDLFEGLEIWNDEKYRKLQGTYPVIFLSFAGIKQVKYNETVIKIKDELIRIYNEYDYIMKSGIYNTNEKMQYQSVCVGMSDTVAQEALKNLSNYLSRYYGKKVIILLDEYDTPMQEAYVNGYWEELVAFTRSLFNATFKTNPYLERAIMTGITRVSKESVFSDLNNLNVVTTTSEEYETCFGFTEQEVFASLDMFGVNEYKNQVKEWYDGYRFGDADIYCPWDVINYCDELRINNMAQPQNYWSNTSSNEAVKRFIQETDKGTVRKEIEKLIAGETIVKEIHQELTYQDMYASIENLWSVLFTTGYLTQTGRKDANTFMLTIPNMEIRNIFLTQIMEYFKKTVSENGEALEKFCNALKDGNSEVVEQSLNNYLKRTISIRDTFVKKQMKENFYHGILLGILGFQQNWSVSSNKESGDGYSDILIETEDQETGIIIEIKYAETGNLEAVSKDALKQIEDRRYEEQLLEEGVEHILKYGIAFYKKKCKVIVVK